MAVALSSRGGNARDGLGLALDGASPAEPARSISGNKPKSVQERRCPRPFEGAEARAAPSNARVRSGSHAWQWRRGQWATAIHRKSFSSRGLEKAAARPIARSYPSVMRGLSPTRSAGNGCARRFSPSAPQRIRPREVSYEEGGRIPREAKSPPSAVLR
jgi:hypothetical protein